jgi:hypothetical protein
VNMRINNTRLQLVLAWSLFLAGTCEAGVSLFFLFSPFAQGCMCECSEASIMRLQRL